MSKRLFVGNLSFKTSETQLQDAFAPYGCTSVTIPTDHDGRPKGFGFVDVADDQLNAAISAWNGKDLSGNQLPDGGTYTLKVTASDAAGAAINATNYVQGVVTGVEQSGGATYLTVNGGKVTWDKVTSVSTPAPPAASTTSTAASGASTPQAGA